MVSYVFFPNSQIPHYPILSIIPASLLHGGTLYILAIGWSSDPSYFRAVHVLPAQLVAAFFDAQGTELKLPFPQ